MVRDFQLLLSTLPRKTCDSKIAKSAALDRGGKGVEKFSKGGGGVVWQNEQKTKNKTLLNFPRAEVSCIQREGSFAIMDIVFDQHTVIKTREIKNDASSFDVSKSHRRRGV